MKRLAKKLVLTAIVGCGVVSLQGCNNGDRPGSWMGYQSVGEPPPWQPGPNQADMDRSGPTEGLRVRPAPTVKSGNPYGLPPSDQELGIPSPAPAGSPTAVSATLPGQAPVPTRSRFQEANAPAPAPGAGKPGTPPGAGKPATPPAAGKPATPPTGAPATGKPATPPAANPH